MIRSAKLKIYELNAGKNDTLSQFRSAYSEVVRQFIDIFWLEQKRIESKPSKQYTDQVQSEVLSDRAIQAAAKQAAGIVNGTLKKHLDRQYRIQEFIKDGMFKKARKLEQIDKKKTLSKPNPKVINPELDGRFFEVNFDNETSFDCWLKMQSLFNRNYKKTSHRIVSIPMNRHKQFDKFFNDKDFSMKNSIMLKENFIEFRFEKKNEKKGKQIPQDKVLGIDIGIKTAFSCSNDYMSDADIHGHTLESIIFKKARKKKGSHGFRKAQTHLKNYIHWALNKINFDGIKKVRIEKIRYMGKFKRLPRKVKGFTYKDIFDMLKMKLELLGVQVEEVQPAFTSQRCSNCGWVRKANRSGKTFKCDKCGFSYDADLNASRNIALDLEVINTKKIRSSGLHRKGFYWNQRSEKPIVSHT